LCFCRLLSPTLSFLWFIHKKVSSLSLSLQTPRESKEMNSNFLAASI
jgi:hypothetical protein